MRLERSRLRLRDLDERRAADGSVATLELDDEAREWIAERGYDPKMGARPMARIIQEHIKRPLAEELLFGSLADGGHVRISVGEPVTINGSVVLRVPRTANVEVIGSVDVPDGWEITETGVRLVGEGTSSYMVTVVSGASLVIEYW